MNPDFPQNERAKLEAKLTALLLGELHASEVAELSQAMEKDPELAALYERLKFTVELVREGAANPKAEEQAPLKLSAERREKLLASFKTVAPKEFVRPRSVMDRLVPWVAAAVIAVFFGYIAIPNFTKTRSTSAKNSIINNVRLLDGAKQQWALENGKSGDAEPTLKELEPYMGRGGSGSLPSVAGETYVPGKVSELPKVETSVSQAKKLFGREVVAEAEVRDGKALVSPLGTLTATPGAVIAGAGVQQTGQLEPGQFAPKMADDFPALKTPIILSAERPSQQVASGANANVGFPIVYSASSDISGALKQLESQQTNSALLGQNSWGLGTSGDKGVASQGAKSEFGAFNSGGFAAGRVFVTNGIAGGVMVDRDSHNLILSADAQDASRMSNLIAQIDKANANPVGEFPGYALAGNSGVVTNGIVGRQMRVVETGNRVGTTNIQALVDSEMLTKSRVAETGQVAFNANSYDDSTSYRMLSKLGVDSEKDEITLNVKNVTNSIAGTRVPLLGDIPAMGHLFSTTESKLADANGKFETALTRDDVSRLRYLSTNAVVASQPNSGDVLAWGAVDGTTNAAGVYSFGGAGAPGLAGANTFAGGNVVNGGSLALNGATHSAGIIQGEERRAEIVLPPAAGDQSGLRNVEQAETFSVLESGGFGGGGGASNPSRTRRVSGGKQVELAAANRGETKAAQPSVNAKFVDVSEETNRALGFDWYLGNKLKENSTVTASGGTMPATAAPKMEGPKELRRESIQTSQLVQDGKIAYQLGKTDEAEAKMNEVLAGDPNNQAALYYLSLLKQTRIRQVVDERNVTSLNRMVQVEKGWADQNTQQQLPVPQIVQNVSDSTNQPRDLRYVTGLDTGVETQLAINNYLRSKGVDMDVAGKSAFFNDRTGTLTVRGTDEDLNKVEAALDDLSAARTNRSNSGSNWWNVPATARAFYSDNANAATGATNKIAEYAAAKEQLDEAKKWRQVLTMKTGQESVDVSLPKARMVSIMDPAVPVAPESLSFGEKVKKAFTGKVESTTRIEVNQERSDIAGVGTVGSGYDPYFLQTEFETIRSDAVLGKVVDNLKLDGGDKSKTEAAVKQLRKNLDLSPVKNTKFIEIGAKSEKSEDAARVANAVAEAYRDYRTEEYNDMKVQEVKRLGEQLKEQDQKIAALQSNVDKLRTDLRIPDSIAKASSVEPLMAYERLSELSSMRVQKQAEYNQQATLLDGLKKMDREKLRKALPIAYSDTELNMLVSELDLAEQNFIKLKLDYAPDHPKVQNAKAAVDDLNRKLDDRIAGLMAGLQAKVDASKASLDRIIQEEQKEDKTDGPPESKIHIPLPLPTPQPEVLTRENAFSTFSLNVSDVSFKLAAASLEKGQIPEPASIRSEEFINAFDYRDPDARDGAPIAFASERARYPFAHNRELLRFSLKTAAAGRQAGRPLNIVLLLDNSGSMERADRVRIIQEAMRVLAGQLQAADTFSIVTFARTAQLRVDGIPGNQAGAAAAEIAKLTPEGGTNLGDALELAYATALRHYLANGDNRVVLLTDGAANLGDVNPDVLKQKVEAHRQQGVALDCFGIGWEGYNDDLLEVLTRNGDGRYGFINSPEEATTEFVAQIAGALHVAASDVKVQVEFNPKRVTSYRQIGYAKHQLTKEQFRDNTVDAAEIAAQEAGNALYTTEIDPQGEGSIATVRVRYKVPGTAEYREQAWDVPYTGGAVALDQASVAMRLAATASAFSEWLATSPFAAEVSTDQLLKYLSGVPQVYGADARPAKLEWMIRQARSISGK